LRYATGGHNAPLYAFHQLPGTVTTRSFWLYGVNKDELVAVAIDKLRSFGRAHGISTLALEWSVT
jgi:hypothetical protein